MQKGAAKADQRRPLAGGALYLTFSCGSSVVIPEKPSARLNRDPALIIGRRDFFVSLF